MGAKLEPAKVETIRMEFLAGSTLRELAQQHGVALRTIAGYSKREKWDEQRHLQQTATAVPDLLRAANRRAEAISNRWRGQIEHLMGMTAEVALAVGQSLSVADLREIAPADLAAMLRTLADVMTKLGGMLPAETETEKQQPVMIVFKGLDEPNEPKAIQQTQKTDRDA